MRTSSSPGHDIDICEEVHDRDAVLVPYGWHGPCVAAPGHDMYYLNVMAGPPNPNGGERAWKISDHPDQTWIRGTWDDLPVDPRLTATSRKDS
jgi:5-deoxy-glucuronate isomerase